MRSIKCGVLLLIAFSTLKCGAQELANTSKEALSNQSPVSARPVAERTMLQICLNSLRSC